MPGRNVPALDSVWEVGPRRDEDDGGSPAAIVPGQAIPMSGSKWKEELTGIQNFSEMPVALNSYVSYLEDELDVPIGIVSVGPDRKQTILKAELSTS